MVWNMQDYPSTMKNLDELVRKKAIDVANALLQDGYPEDRAIPIATKQAQEWYDNASPEEKETFRQEAPPQKNDPHNGKKQNEFLLNTNVQVKHQRNQWQVISKGAKKPSEIYDNKNKAIERAKYIAQNKGTKLEIYKQDGQLQETRDYS